MSGVERSAEIDALRAMADHVVMLPLTAVLAGWRDGDERGWQAEFDMLRTEKPTKIDMLASSIQTDGIRLPILLGSDGRVWDGHHRLCAADLLALESVPCEFADPAAVVIHGAPKVSTRRTDWGVRDDATGNVGTVLAYNRATTEQWLAELTEPSTLMQRERTTYEDDVTEWSEVATSPGQQATS